MKKISLILVLIILVAMFTGCRKQFKEYSFGPNVDVTSITQEYKDYLQKQLENTDKAERGLSFVGYNAEYDDEGGFVVDGFFRNNTGSTVYNISGVITIQTVTKSGGLTIAKAKFTLSEEDFGALENGIARPWQLKYSSDLVVNKVSDLSTYSVNADLEYSTR